MLLLAMACTAVQTPTYIPGTVPTNTDLPGDTDVPVTSGCTVTSSSVDCPFQTTIVPGIGGVDRDVLHAVPRGTPPTDGWPVALLFQGSFFAARTFFSGQQGDLLGRLHQANLTEQLLGAGYAVVAPEAHLEGGLFWDTNVPPFSFSWEGSPDDILMHNLLDAIGDGTLGPLNRSDLVATGISSGGYMTSRMAVSYAGEFRALAIQSASYATCSGVFCVVPDLPDDHPPTLFLHGRNDLVVPLFTTRPYRSRLEDQGTLIAIVIDNNAGHAWFEGGPESIVSWFQENR